MNRAMRRAMKSKGNRKAVGSNFSSKNNKVLIDHKAATANTSIWSNYNKDKMSKEETA